MQKSLLWLTEERFQRGADADVFRVEMDSQPLPKKETRYDDFNSRRKAIQRQTIVVAVTASMKNLPIFFDLGVGR